MRISRRKKHNVKPSKTIYRYNDRIRVPEVRVIDENGEHFDVMSIEKARAMATERGLDLVEINPAANPPITKIMEYGQFKYQQEKLEKTRKSKQKEIGTKGIRLSGRIGQHDLDVRKKQAIKFLNSGNSVRLEIILRGREKGHQDISFKVITDFIAAIKQEMDIRVEQPPKRQGSKIAGLIVKTGDKKTAQDTTDDDDDETNDTEDFA